MGLQALFFYLFAFVAVASAFMVISARNPVHSVLFLILTFINASGLLLLTGAEFLAMILLVVYVFNFIDRQIITILAPDIKADLGLDDADIALGVRSAEADLDAAQLRQQPEDVEHRLVDAVGRQRAEAGEVRLVLELEGPGQRAFEVHAVLVGEVELPAISFSAGIAELDVATLKSLLRPLDSRYEIIWPSHSASRRSRPATACSSPPLPA